MAFVRDVRYAVRSVSKSPGFALTAVVTLALGIGATTAIFSVCDAMLWKPIPLPHIESLVMVHQAVPGDPGDFTDGVRPADVADIRAQSDSLRGPQFINRGSLANIVTQGGEPERADESLVSANFFDVLAVQPQLGRGFRASDDEPGAAHVVVFSDGFWRRRFGADPSIIGRTIRLDDRNATVIGVMPASVNFPLPTEVWTPLAFTLEQRRSRTNQSVAVIARLKPGRTLPQAAAEIDGIARRLEAEYPDVPTRTGGFGAVDAVFPSARKIKRYALLLFWSVMLYC